VRWLRWWLELAAARHRLYLARTPLAATLTKRDLERVELARPRWEPL
jgi:hypothetical protein